MQLADLLCCLLLTITLAATCTRAEEERPKREIAVGRPRKLLKRDAAIFIDNFPIESSVYTQKPKIVYRRISRQRYGPPKSKYGPPRPKYRSPPKPRKPSKHKKPSSKYGPPSHKKRSPKPRYGPPKRPPTHGSYGPPKKVPSHYYTPEPAGFAEPPGDYETQQPKHSYAEPPVDSYGAPLKSQIIDNYPNAPSFNENPTPFDSQDFSNQDMWQNYREQNQDTNYAYSKKRPLFAKPEEIFEQQQHHDEEDFNLNTYSDVYNIGHQFKEPPYFSSRKKKPQYFTENKKTNKHWKAPRYKDHESIKSEGSDEILVGGQYAEPPPRYVPKFQPSAPMYEGNEDFGPPKRYGDLDVSASAPISPYVNYKHSNMAFSPQNLNDAFSIVDK